MVTKITFTAETGNEDFLQLLYAAVPDAIITTNAHGLILTTNKAVEAMFGFEQTELVGKSLGELIAQPYRDESERRIATYMTSGNSSDLKISRQPRLYGCGFMAKRKGPRSVEERIQVAHGAAQTQ